MVLPDRYDLNRAIPDAALRKHRSWLIAYDEEGVEGQSEATIKPNDIDEPTLPGYVTAEIGFADGGSALGLVGGDFGVSALADLDNMRIYDGGRVWELQLSPGSYEPSDDDFPDAFAARFPLRVEISLSGVFDDSVADFGFTILANGSISDGGT